MASPVPGSGMTELDLDAAYQTKAIIWNEQKAGFVCAGVVKAIRRGVGQNKSDLIEIEDGHGVFAVWHTARLHALFEIVAPGDRVEIEYLGKRRNPVSGREEHNFRVSHGRGQGKGVPF